jgi:hypothetical protein
MTTFDEVPKNDDEFKDRMILLFGPHYNTLARGIVFYPHQVAAVDMLLKYNGNGVCSEYK